MAFEFQKGLIRLIRAAKSARNWLIRSARRDEGRRRKWKRISSKRFWTSNRKRNFRTKDRFSFDYNFKILLLTTIRLCRMRVLALLFVTSLAYVGKKGQPLHRSRDRKLSTICFTSRPGPLQ